MQWAEIWTSGVHDNVVSGVILFIVLGALGLALAWIRSWRMRNPWVWLVSSLREDMGLNLGAFICSLVLIASMAAVVSADLSSKALYTSLAVGVVSFLLFGWFSFFVDSTEAGSSKPLLYRHKARPAAPAENTPPPVAVREKKTQKASNLSALEFNILKFLHQTRGQYEGVSVEKICSSRELEPMEVILALTGLTGTGLVEEIASKSGRRYRLTADGESAFKKKFAPETESVKTATRIFKPSLLQAHILHFFWNLNPNKRESVASISKVIEQMPNEIAHALDGLCKQGLVTQLDDPLTGTSFFLNNKGRSFCSETWGHAAATSTTPKV